MCEEKSHAGRRPREDGGRHGSNAGALQVAPRLPATSGSPERKGRILPSISEGRGPCSHPGFRLLASRTMREYISAVSNHQGCGILLAQP